jgi:hypothetical protein
MAIPNNYIDKITDNDNGESRLICPAAENVRVENENFEADNLNEVLDELAEAAQQGGIKQESDPVFGASPAAGITAEDIARWNAGSSGGSGYNASVVNHKLVFSGSTQPQVVNHKLIL